jgi:hypothetical protein
MRIKVKSIQSAVASIVFLTGCAGLTALADSEASFQAGGESSKMSSTENGHVGESENGHSSVSQSTTDSQSSAHHENSSQAHEEAGRLPVTQPSITNAPAGQTTSKAAATNATGASVANQGASRPTSATATHPTPVMKTTTYHWNKRGSHAHASYSRGANRRYMVNTIHQAASTK